MSKQIVYAFPLDYSEKGFGEQGMTLRDWFAGQALVGWLSSFGPDQSPTAPYTALAQKMYGIADAMLAERGKE